MSLVVGYLKLRERPLSRLPGNRVIDGNDLGAEHTNQTKTSGIAQALLDDDSSIHRPQLRTATARERALRLPGLDTVHRAAGQYVEKVT